MRHLALAALLVTLAMRPAPALASTEAMCDSPPCTQDEIATYEKRVIRHLLRVQRLRFEAEARGDSQRVDRLEREFKRTRERRVEARRAIDDATN